jgi:hypothetical protein
MHLAPNHARQVSCLELFTELDKELIFQWFLIEQLRCNCKLLQNGGMSGADFSFSVQILIFNPCILLTAGKQWSTGPYKCTHSQHWMCKVGIVWWND